MASDVSEAAKRGSVVFLRLNLHERAMLEAAAERERLKPTEYLRALIRGASTAARKE